MSNDTHRRVFNRLHEDLFSGSRYDAEFFNYSGGSYDPSSGDITGESRNSIGTVNVEIVPPSMDSGVDVDGTSFSWDTSIRFPQDESIVGSLTPLGADNDRPTEVEVTNQEDNSTEVFELHSYTTELGSGMIMARLVEQ